MSETLRKQIRQSKPIPNVYEEVFLSLCLAAQRLEQPWNRFLQAREKIKRVHDELERGADFSVLATKASEDPDTARTGGELGATPESQLKNTDPATRDAINKLRPGQFSDVIQVVNPNTHQSIGYRIVKLNGKEAAGQRDLSDPSVQQLIRSQLRNQREQFLRAAYDEVLHDEAEIQNYYAANILKNTGRK